MFARGLHIYCGAQDPIMQLGRAHKKTDNLMGPLNLMKLVSISLNIIKVII